MKIRLTLVLLSILAFARPSSAATLTVCASGCTYNLSQFQTAINAAVYGDTITIKAGETVTGNFTLPNKGAGSTFITITSDTTSTNLPPAGQRIDGTYAQFMPIIQSGNTLAAITTALGAHHYKFIGVNFTGNTGGFNMLLMLGDNTSQFEAGEATDITVDRCWLHASNVVGQKRGIELNGKRLIVINSTLEGFAGYGQDSQAIAGFNGRGPITIENNTLQAAGYATMFGGSDPPERTELYVNCSPAPTTTTANVTIKNGGHDLNELVSGQLLAVLISGGTNREWTHLTSATSGTTAVTINFEAVPIVPDCGTATPTTSDIRGGAIFSGVTVRHNYITKDIGWKDPILPTPPSVTATPVVGTGTLVAGTYCYRVQGVQTNSYQLSTIVGNASAEVCATLTATGHVDIAWGAISRGSHYDVYGRTGGGENQSFRVTAPTTTYTDTGSAGTAGSIRGGDKWVTKNLFEFKAVQNLLVSGNVMENEWYSGGGYGSFWLKTVNQASGSGTPDTGMLSEFFQTKDVIVENNIFRHINGWLVFSGQERAWSDSCGGCNAADFNNPAPMTNVTVRNNLVYDSRPENTDLGYAGGPIGVMAINALGRMDNVTIQHNTIVHYGNSFSNIGNLQNTPTDKVHSAINMQLLDNMGRRETYGVFSSFGEGKAALDAMTQSYTFTKNALAGINTSLYPAGNFGPSVADWEACFVNYSPTGDPNTNGPADYHLKSTCAFHNAGTDGKDLGADVDAVLTATAGAVQGGAAGANNVAITTSSLPNATQSVVYTAPVAITGGVSPFTFSISVGALPTGLTINTSTGTISGTPSGTGTATFTVRVQDSQGTPSVATQPLSIVVQAAPVSISWATTSPLTAGTLSTPYSVTLAASGDRTPYTWALVSGTLPTGVTLNPVSGVLSGVPSATGVSSFTLSVSGTNGTTASRAFSLTIAGVTGISDRPLVSGPVPQQIAAYVGPTAPSVATKGCCQIGDEWTDTSVNPPVKKQVSAIAPLTFAVYSADAHNLLSDRHGDTIADTPQAGDLIAGTTQTIQNPDGTFTAGTPKWQRLALGTAGQVLTSTGTSVGWATGGGSGAVTNSWLIGGNTIGSATPQYFGSKDATTVHFQTNGVSNGFMNGTSGEWTLDPQTLGQIKFSLVTTDTTDPYGIGFSTSKSSRAYLYSLQGSKRQAFGLSDVLNDPEVVLGFSSSSDSGATWKWWWRIYQNGLVQVRNLTLDGGTAQPTCTVTIRGQFWYVAAATTVKDTVAVCAKDAADAYAWRTIY